MYKSFIYYFISINGLFGGMDPDYGLSLSNPSPWDSQEVYDVINNEISEVKQLVLDFRKHVDMLGNSADPDVIALAKKVGIPLNNRIQDLLKSYRVRLRAKQELGTLLCALQKSMDRVNSFQ